MDRDTLVKTMKTMKAKARAAKKAGKPGVAKAFANGSARLLRQIKRTKAPSVAAATKGE